MKELKVRIRHRINEADVWFRVNPILEAGEMGIESDTGKFKYGDGKHPWQQLEYAFGSGIELTIFNGYDNEKTDDNKEQVGDLSNADKVFKPSQYKASDYPGQIILIPQSYSIKTIDEETKEETIENFVMDTPYISLRKNGVWYWTVFSDQVNKPMASSALDYFQLDVSILG